MRDKDTGSEAGENEGGALAIMVTILVLALIVALFLLFKFNLFNGGTSVNTRTTASALPLISSAL